MTEERSRLPQDELAQPPHGVSFMRPLAFDAALPRTLTTFVGREHDLAVIGDLLVREDVRLLTLAGPGGAGKTRLAIRAGKSVAEDTDHAVWFVSLVAVRDPGQLLPEILRALGLRDVSGRSAREVAVALLRERPALLILDNFEPVIDAGQIVVDLLVACPELTVLVTSRIVLGVSGEHVYRVPPLALPADTRRADVEALREVEAVRLFVERARARLPGFSLTAANAATVGEICRQLDGLPLAIELAAARMASLSPAALLSLLRHRLTLLTRGPRDAPARHQSMREAIAWSHDLLESTERLAFRRLAVFSGGFSLAAAQAVLPGVDVVDVIDSLVAKSLVVAHGDGNDGDPRYHMLETLREFGLERLEEAGDVAVWELHARYYLAVAEDADYCWFMNPADGAPRLNRLYADEANIRSALGWFQREGDAASLLRMAGCLGGLWVVGGRSEEGRRWLEAGLAMPDEVSPMVRARAMAVLSWTVNTRGDPVRAVELAEPALVELRRHPPGMDLVRGLILVGVPSHKLGRVDHAERHLGEALAVLQSLDGPPWRRNVAVTILIELGMTALVRGDIDTAAVHTRSAIDLQLETGHGNGESHIYGHVVLILLGDLARARGDPAEALRSYQRLLELGWRYRNMRAVAYALGGVAGALAAAGDIATAARMFGACEAFNETYSFPFEQEVLERQRALGLPEPWLRAGESFGDFERLRDAMSGRPGHDSLDAAAAERWQAGRRVPIGEAVREALASTIEPRVSRRDAELPFGLTEREREVLRLLVAGDSDAAIAETLYISRRTVATHVQHIYDKLGVSSRAAAAATAVRNGLA